MSTELQPYRPQELASNLEDIADQLRLFLDQLDLPSEGVLVVISERRDIINNLPGAVASLTQAYRADAMYISKFVAACTMGLFDAALNYLWDETIRNLRDKVKRFDLTYFYDSVIADASRRAKFKDESHLEKIEDWELIRGCRETGIISDVGFRHLDYIRDMRNHASAAHPNHNELSGLQLAAWLLTCIREVLGRDPEGPVLEVGKLLYSLRHETLSASDVPPIAAAIQRLSDDLSRSLLRTITGMYSDGRIDAQVRSNIRLVARQVWQTASADARYEAGVKQATFSVNAEVSRAQLAREFLELVDGLSYLPGSALALEVAAALDRLMAAHTGWHNFYNEPPHAKILAKLIPLNGEVPDSVRSRYIKVLTMCRMGNGYGVSFDAAPLYEALISKWQDTDISLFVRLVRDADVASRLQFSSCAKIYQQIAASLQGQATSTHLKRALEFLMGFHTEQLSNVGKVARFQEIVKTLE